MKRDMKKFWNYVPMPFWSMDHEKWLKYANDLKGDDRKVLSYFPFKWPYVPANDAATAKQFLDEIAVGSDNISPDSIENCYRNLPTFEKLKKKRSVEWSEREFSDDPGYNFRMIPEWEPMAGVLLNWPIFYPPLWETFRQMITGLDHVTTFLRIPEGDLGAAALAWLNENGIGLNKVRPIPGPIGDIWARDYSPIYGIDTCTGKAIAHKFVFTAFYEAYREEFKSIVEIDDRFTWTEGYEIRRSRIMMDGGNLLTNGNGTYIMTRRVLTDNSSINNLYAKLEAWLGADHLIIVDEEPGDILGHVCNFKIIGPERAVVGLPDKEDTPIFKYLMKIRNMFTKLGFEVVDVPCPVGFQHLLPGDQEYDYPAAYSNSLMVNKRLLLPQYDREDLEKYNAEAVDALKDALPDYEIIPIEASILGNGGGAINCSTKEIPDV